MPSRVLFITFILLLYSNKIGYHHFILSHAHLPNRQGAIILKVINDKWSQRELKQFCQGLNHRGEFRYVNLVNMFSVKSSFFLNACLLSVKLTGQKSLVIEFFLSIWNQNGWSQMAERLGNWAINQKVAGSFPRPWKMVLCPWAIHFTVLASGGMSRYLL